MLLSAEGACTMRERDAGYNIHLSAHSETFTTLGEEGFRTQPPSQVRKPPRILLDASSELSDDFFLRIADLCVNDPSIARLVDDDRTSSVIWGNAKSKRFRFLQMCIRDRHERCREIWAEFQSSDRRDFLQLYNYGPPSPDFFMDLVARERSMGLGDCGVSSCGSDSGCSEQSEESLYGIIQAELWG